MNSEVDPIQIGEVEDIEIGTVENFEHEDNNFAIFRLATGFFPLREIATVKREPLLVRQK